jgi:hypothetical protein
MRAIIKEHTWWLPTCTGETGAVLQTRTPGQARSWQGEFRRPACPLHHANNMEGRDKYLG